MLTLSLHRVGLLTQLVPDTSVLEYNYNFIWTVPSRDAPNNPHRNNYAYGCQGVALYVYDTDADNRGNADWRLWFEVSSENCRALG
jgi:hypothetical protein